MRLGKSVGLASKNNVSPKLILRMQKIIVTKVTTGLKPMLRPKTVLVSSLKWYHSETHQTVSGTYAVHNNDRYSVVDDTKDGISNIVIFRIYVVPVSWIRCQSIVTNVRYFDLELQGDVSFFLVVAYLHNQS